MADDFTRVDALIDELLAAHDPRRTDLITFRGAQYDRGLAWVHFPEGFGGLDLAPLVLLLVIFALQVVITNNMPVPLYR